MMKSLLGKMRKLLSKRGQRLLLEVRMSEIGSKEGK